MAELLKRHRIPFRHRVVIDGREVDFIVGRYAVEVNGHAQDPRRNAWLFSLGLTPLHVPNALIRDDPQEIEEHVIPKLKKQPWPAQTTSRP